VPRGPAGADLGGTSCVLPARGCVGAASSRAAVTEDITWTNVERAAAERLAGG